MKKTYRNMALAAACVLTATGLWGCSTSVQIPDTVKVQQGDSSDNRITVSGMEEVKAVPDMAQIQYSVYTQAATAQECQEENAKNVNQTLETLKGLGVEEKSIQTSDYGLSPIYDWNSGRQKITGYQMSTSITVSDIPVENAGKIITASVASGVNELDSVQYLCSDYDEKYQEALKMAVEMAKNKADGCRNDGCKGSKYIGRWLLSSGEIQYSRCFCQADDDGGCCCRYGRYAGRSVHRSPGKRNF